MYFDGQRLAGHQVEVVLAVEDGQYLLAVAATEFQAYHEGRALSGILYLVGALVLRLAQRQGGAGHAVEVGLRIGSAEDVGVCRAGRQGRVACGQLQREGEEIGALQPGGRTGPETVDGGVGGRLDACRALPQRVALQVVDSGADAGFAGGL